MRLAPLSALLLFVLPGCPRGDSLLVGGESQPIDDIIASFGQDADGLPTLDILLLSDPGREPDDGLAIALTIPLQREGDAGVDLAAAPVAFDYTCRGCGGAAAGAPSVSGFLSVQDAGDGRFFGEIDAVISGADPDGTDLGEVQLFARFEFPR